MAIEFCPLREMQQLKAQACGEMGGGEWDGTYIIFGSVLRIAGDKVVESEISGLV